MRRVSWGQPVLVRYSNHEWSREVVIILERFRGNRIMFCEASGARNQRVVIAWW